jgi:hypothetical protein
MQAYPYIYYPVYYKKRSRWPLFIFTLKMLTE